MNNFTNKPWHVVEGRTYGSIEVLSGETAIAEMWRRGDKSTELANAKLMAAAPDLLKQRDELLAALMRLEFAAQCRDNTSGDACRLLEVKAELAEAARQARTVIAKARGES